MEEPGVSREEVLEGLVPTAGAANKGCKDPALKALEDFLKMHKTMEVASGKVVSWWVFCEVPSKGPWSRELAAKKLAPPPPLDFPNPRPPGPFQFPVTETMTLSSKSIAARG